MNIILASNQKYIKYVAVMLLSLCENNAGHIDAYVLNGGGISEDVEILADALDHYDIKIHNVEIGGKNFLKDCPSNADWTIEMYYRLFVPWIKEISVDRALYLDVDIIVNGSLEELYYSDFEDMDLIAAPDCNGEIKIRELSEMQQKMLGGMIGDGEYFNSGMMLLNLERIRLHYPGDVYENAIKQWNYQMSAPDQDILNYVHAGKVKYCNWEKYDLFARNAHKSGEKYDDVKKSAVIIHFAGQKPWNSTGQIHYDIEKIWWDYALKTTFGEKLAEDYIAQSTMDESIELILRDEIRKNDELTEINTKLRGIIEKINKESESTAGEKFTEQCKISREFLEFTWPEIESELTWEEPLKSVDYDLTVIIPCYNQERYIEQCMNSVIYQEHGYKLKIVVVDDGSTDDSPALIDRYAIYDNVKIIHQPNGGVSAARNAALREANSRYVFFLDGDDLIADGAVDAMMKDAFRIDADVIEYDFWDIPYTTGKESVFRLNENGPEQDDVRSICWDEMSGYVWGKLFRRHLFDRICFPENYWYEDSVIKGLVIPCGRSLYKSGKGIYVYRLNPSGATQQTIGNIRSVESLYIMEKTITAHAGFGFPSDMKWYEYLLGWIALTYVRTSSLDATVKTAVFFRTAEIIERYCPKQYAASEHLKLMEKGLRTYNFNTYCQGCAVAWNRIIGKE